jgi:hypothetical protein
MQHKGYRASFLTLAAIALLALAFLWFAVPEAFGNFPDPSGSPHEPYAKKDSGEGSACFLTVPCNRWLNFQRS